MKVVVAKPLVSSLRVLIFALLLGAQSALAQSDTPKVEIGAQFTGLHLSYHYQGREGSNIFTDNNWFGFGGRVTYNITSRVALEAAITKFKTDEFSPPTFDNDAQPDVQGLFGVKAGWRHPKFGVFGKLRPGFTRFTPVFDCADFNFSACSFDRHTTFSLDAGGVIEGYLSRHIMVRGDIGGTYLRHPDTTRFFPGEPGIPPFQFTSQGFKKVVPQFSVGVGFRF
jgi:hypothetical protein